RLPLLPRGLEPGGFGKCHFTDRLLGRRTECGAVLEVRDVSDVTCVVFAKENVDMVILHSASPNLRLYWSMSSRSCLIWYGFALPFFSCSFSSSGTWGCV